MGTLKVNNIQSTTDGSVTFPQGSVNSSNSTINGNLSVSGTTTTNNIRFQDGSFSTPSVSFTNDTNTGLYRISEDKIGVSIGGVRTGEIGSGYGGFTGNIIQVQSTSITSSFANQSLTYTDIGLSCSIIPKYSTSKILILTQILFALDATADSSGRYFGINLVRNSTQISEMLNTSIVMSGGGFGGWTSLGNFSYLDSPNTINSITYKCQSKVISSTSYRITTGYSNSNSTITLLEVQQ
jgi:hypothetical protein